MTILIPDCSNNNWGSEELTDQGRANLMAFLAALPDHFGGLEHKMSQGSDYADPYGPIAQSWCGAHEMPFLGYHFATTDNPSAQAANWISAGGSINAMIDFEQVDDGNRATLAPDDFWSVVNAFNSAGVNVPLAYIPEWYADDIEMDLSALRANGIGLISSAYPLGYSGGDPVDMYRACDGGVGEGWAPYRGGLPIMWQFTSSAKVGSFNSIDINAFEGTDVTSLFGTITPT